MTSNLDLILEAAQMIKDGREEEMTDSTVPSSSDMTHSGDGKSVCYCLMLTYAANYAIDACYIYLCMKAVPLLAMSPIVFSIR